MKCQLSLMCLLAQVIERTSSFGGPDAMMDDDDDGGEGERGKGEEEGGDVVWCVGVSMSLAGQCKSGRLDTRAEVISRSE